ncbi:hypothetical protein FNU79_06960 [Deinococcus detaillensis]|uniref:Uncharacterized protein n=1 Tax=Deinococcus detaillensis TaxID=2592048 RepID=A0A553V1Y9_9DEIO|nr:hypothetical protein [Deinococcus detaillensis]TSA86394.1 hypothetical protein FNU79_06960 [Deinococcus detaillensis]
MGSRHFRRILPALSLCCLLGGLTAWSGAATFQTTGQGVPTSVNDWRSKLGPLLPQTGQLAQIMETRAKFSMTEVRRRVLDAGGDPRLLDQMQVSAERGVAPLYDKRVKISENDFRRYLVIQQELQVSGKVVRLSISRSGNRLTFGDAGGTALLRGISLDLETGDLRFPEGFSAKPEALNISAIQAASAEDPLGKRSGYVWNVRGSNPFTLNALNGHFALLSLGDGSVLVSYNRNGILNGTVSTGTLILNFNRDTAAPR